VNGDIGCGFVAMYPQYIDALRGKHRKINLSRGKYFSANVDLAKCLQRKKFENQAFCQKYLCKLKFIQQPLPPSGRYAVEKPVDSVENSRISAQISQKSAACRVCGRMYIRLYKGEIFEEMGNYVSGNTCRKIPQKIP